jgi:hypothetical protein
VFAIILVAVTGLAHDRELEDDIPHCLIQLYDGSLCLFGFHHGAGVIVDCLAFQH